MEIQIEKISIEAHPRSINTRVTIKRRGKKFCFHKPWTIEPVQDIVAIHCIDLESLSFSDVN